MINKVILIVGLFLLFSCDKSNTVVIDNVEDKSITSGMKLIPSKNVTFRMGKSNNLGNEYDPQHNVTITYDFYMDSTEVTQKAFDDLMKMHYESYKTLDWSIEFGKGDNYPAYMVVWNYAAAYCNARSKEAGLDLVYTFGDGSTYAIDSRSRVSIDLTKNGFRLPTEAEFEFACRANTETDYFWGKNFEGYFETTEDSIEMSKYAVWSGNSNNSSNEVASKKPNGFGLYDMSGNIEEWCNDHYGQYSTEDQFDPIDLESDTMRVTRGGSWGANEIYHRSGHRGWSAPDYKYHVFGFRCVLPVAN